MKSSLLFFLAAPIAALGLDRSIESYVVPSLCIPPTEITEHPGGARTYPGNVTITLQLNEGSQTCDAHKDAITVTWAGSIALNLYKGASPTTYTMAGCHEKGHVVHIATNSSGWVSQSKTENTLEATFAHAEKKQWYKFDLDNAVRDTRRKVKRILGVPGDMDEAFDMKIPGCADGTKVDLEFGLGKATTKGTWSDEAVEVTVEGTFGSGKGNDGGKYKAVFKTEKEVEKSSTSDKSGKSDDKTDKAESATEEKESGAVSRGVQLGSVILVSCLATAML
ncbi:hypothetical protein EX30DRAFT_341784 [Ascodesmis nigricans]|uniref:Uncharacterized protein n=1 Tax=Ascodesmis nigricans TaxID=341454 RepID=A0A4S2MUJ1_9PEZI|nr:hypothetical protein EX30DRAFT_341784 [Ascodesmis nigricans]